MESETVQMFIIGFLVTITIVLSLQLIQCFSACTYIQLNLLFFLKVKSVHLFFHSTASS
jgi:hypothetical protein